MNIRLAGGVVDARRSAWIAGPSGPVRADGAGAEPGTPVALGPEDAPDGDVRRAVAALRVLVAGGGDVAAGAGVDLGARFRSGRLEGARGDRRDAVLAALRAVGVRDARRLGDRAAVMVALFGPSATKRVGAAAARAAEEGRWDALHVASAASDVLGPEQLERVLELAAPEPVVPGGSPSALGADLRRVLAPVPRPRRPDLVLDLWRRVAEHRVEEARRERRRATQSRRDRVADLHARRRHSEDERVLQWARGDLGADASFADYARWVPPDAYWHIALCGLYRDALAATALLRTAVAVADHGVREGLARSADLLDAAVEQARDDAAVYDARRVPGLTGLPPRPGAYVRDLRRKVGEPEDARLAGYVRPRLACARDFALVVVQDIVRALDEVDTRVPETALRGWAEVPVGGWRRGAGYGVRPPEEWDGIGPWAARMLDRAPLPARVAEAGGDAAGAEVIGDFLWYVDLIDALAQVHGRERAQAEPGTGEPWFSHDAEPEPDDRPGYASVTQAVAGTARLVAFGGVPPGNARTWPALVESLLTGTAVTEALTGEFAVPAPLAALDGAEVGGHRAKVARTARDLAEWAGYMGNCIAAYFPEGESGKSVLVGLYGASGRLVANAEVVRLRPAARGWCVAQIEGRFNQEAPRELAAAFRARVEALPGDAPAAEEGGAPDAGGPPARPARRGAGDRLLAEAGPALRELVRVDGAALGVLAAVAATAPDAAAVRIGRSDLDRLARDCARALDGRAADLAGLWEATAHRPLRDAVEALDPAARDRLAPLSGEPPLPKSLRRLVRLPGIADAHAIELAARRVRRAVGLLAVRDDPALARAVRRRPAAGPLCALAVHVTCARPGIALAEVAAPRRATVPGFPAASLADEDGPWRRAFPVVRELGADTGAFWDEAAEHGLRVPASWLGSGGWPALWARAHRG
ncbi:hypothetical protein [Actinomadura sp. WAC 06369]|uniref:hypothetical protein n=1 Tax=Actinomadura sp. WAC 06369 TaxID=2203193 RepID=UPI00131565E8|nr:hypothetical protein [Actinomadura sp. WAC 06369]